MTSPADAAAPAPLPALVPDDLACLRCGYSLKGLAPTSVCPECATPVERSLLGDLFRFSDPCYVRTLHRGAVVVLIGFLLKVAFVLGFAFLGAMQDHSLDRRLREQNPAIYAKVTEPERTAYLMTFRPIDKEKELKLPEAERKIVQDVRAENSQTTLAKVAVPPVIMCVFYLGLIAYFRARGGYKPVELVRQPAGSPPA